MQIRRNKLGIELSDKERQVLLSDATVKIGELVIDETGEYEADSVAVVFSTNGALVVFDQLRVVYVTKFAKPNKFEEEEFDSADVVVFSPVSSADKDVVNSIIDIYDPKVVVFAEKVELGGLNLEETAVVKVSKLALSEEGREFYALSSR